MPLANVIYNFRGLNPYEGKLVINENILPFCIKSNIPRMIWKMGSFNHLFGSGISENFRNLLKKMQLAICKYILINARAWFDSFYCYEFVPVPAGFLFSFDHCVEVQSSVPHSKFSPNVNRNRSEIPSVISQASY